MTKRTLVFVGIDSWNRPVFKAIESENCYIGDCDNLFDYGTPEETILEFYKGKNLHSTLVYFGGKLDCEPNGARLNSNMTFEIKARKEVLGNGY